MTMLKGLGGTALALAAAESITAQALNVIEKILSNGMKLLMVERHDDQTFAAGWMARVGSVNECPGITGSAHLFEHMMFKGSKTLGTRDAKRDAELNALQDQLQVGIRQEHAVLRERQRRGEIANRMEPKVRTPRLQQLLDQFDAAVKAQRQLIVKDEIWRIHQEAGATGLNASTSQDRTFYIVSLPSNKLELWMWMESDRIANPVFREFYSERDVIQEERRQTLESRPDGRVGEAYQAMTWMAAPYHGQVIGWPSDIATVTREAANEFFATYYAPNNITAILLGDFDPAKAHALPERYFSRVPANPRGVPEVTTLEPAQPAEQRMIAEVESSPSFQVEYKTVPGVHKDAPALQVLAGVLSGAGGGMGGGGPRGGGGGGMRASGRLTKALVLDKKVATSASASSRGQKYGGLFSLRATPAPDRRPEELEPLRYAEPDRIVKDGITEEELARYKNAQQVAQYSRFESNTGIREALAQAVSGGDWRALLEQPRRIQAVTREDVQRVARQYFPKEARNVLITTRKGAPPEGSPRRRPAARPTTEVK